MSCVNQSVCKLCRRENVKLFLKGDRCYSDKCSFERRPYPPGQHGQARLKFSEYALQLREKQKTKRFYGLSEKQFSKTFVNADSSKDITGFALLKKLETRLDNVVYHLGIGNSRREARQIISHKHILVNGVKVNIPSIKLKKGDVVEVLSSSKSSDRILSSVKASARRNVPAWLEFNSEALKGVVKDMPVREDITVPVEENMIVEFYSR